MPQGDITVKDGIANLKDIKFNMLGGLPWTERTTRWILNIQSLIWLKIDNLSIPKRLTHFQS